MNTRIDKDELIDILRQNRANHQHIFDEAVEGYRKEAIKQLNEAIDRIKTGSLTRVYFSIPAPENHTADYDRAIRMLELNQEGTVVLNESDTAQYVMDDWGWRNQFIASNKYYSATADAIAQNEGL